MQSQAKGFFWLLIQDKGESLKDFKQGSDMISIRFLKTLNLGFEWG